MCVLIDPAQKKIILGYSSHHGGQGVHLRRVQEGERQLPCKLHSTKQNIKKFKILLLFS